MNKFTVGAIVAILLAFGGLVVWSSINTGNRIDYDKYDYLIAMDDENLYYTNRCWANDPDHKIKMLLSFAGKDRDIADPWYTGNFDQTYEDIMEGCSAFLDSLK